VGILMTALMGSIDRQGGIDAQPDNVFQLTNKLTRIKEQLLKAAYDEMHKPVGRGSISYDFVELPHE
jgi:hypothetical protein